MLTKLPAELLSQVQNQVIVHLQAATTSVHLQAASNSGPGYPVGLVAGGTGGLVKYPLPVKH